MYSRWPLIVYALFICASIFHGSAYAEIRVLSPNGSYITKLSLADAAKDADVAGKRVLVTSSIIINNDILWPPDRELEVSIGSILTFKDGKKMTGLKFARPEWWGAKGDNISNDTAAIQAAIDAVKNGIVEFSPGTYRIARIYGTNDKWGIRVSRSNVTLKGNQSFLRRYNTDISTFALAYPILFIGVPDNDAAFATENVKIVGINFIGENTRHSKFGDSLGDFRTAIEIKNSKNTLIERCNFSRIDSSAIYYQQPAAYDYAHRVYYNLTKNYDSKIINCSFIAESHSIPGRALLHAIDLSGVDNAVVSNNYFEWCDDCVASSGGSYNDAMDKDTDVFDPGYQGWTLGAIRRTGRGWLIKGNTALNSSEHPIYVSGFDVTISENIFKTDQPAICHGDIKVRSRKAMINNNTVVSGNSSALTIGVPALNVTVTDNKFSTLGDPSEGVISIAARGLSKHIEARRGMRNYYPMANIIIQKNIIEHGAAKQEKGVGIRILTDIADHNYPKGQIHDLTISDNLFKNHKVAVYFVNAMVNSVNIVGNTFLAKPFAKSDFASASDFSTHAVVQVNHRATEALRSVVFDNNKVYGATYIFSTDDVGSVAELPSSIQNNTFEYVKYFKTKDIRPADARHRFAGNKGKFLMESQ